MFLLGQRAQQWRSREKKPEMSDVKRYRVFS